MKEEETVVHEGKLFEKVEFKEKSIANRKFTDCKFKSCQLNMLSFVDCYFTDCIFDSCDLSLLKVKGCFFNRVQIIRCKAIGINWFDTGSPFSVQFIDSNISYSSFFAKAIKKAKFKNCVGKEADFSGCNLTGADFGGTDLENARFSNSDISQADFKEARNYYIDLLHNKVAKAKFSLPEALSLLDPFDIIIE
jgi:fluoroquinolone resistance protein